MKNKTTELVFIIDRSCSMYHRINETINEYNAMIRECRGREETTYITTVTFDDNVHLINNRMPAELVKPLLANDCRVKGCSAYRDALGFAIEHIATAHKYLGKREIPENVEFVIFTDRVENTSKNYSRLQIKQLIKEYSFWKDWKFTFRYEI